VLRACGKRMMVAAAGGAALVLIAAGCAGVMPSRKTPAFAQIPLSENSAVYIQIQGDELRSAMSVEGAQTAAPVRAGSEFTLPVPADQLPAGVATIKASLLLTQFQSGANAAIAGQLTVSWTDDRKAEWQYVSQFSVPAGGCWEGAPIIKLPNPADVKASLEATPGTGKLSVGLRLTADGAALADVRKDGQPVQVQMIVADASGAVIASKVGTLADFGFS
jgi:hypothetical protein